MRINKPLAGGCICAFGVGTVFAVFLPAGAMLVILGALTIGAGAMVLCR